MVLLILFILVLADTSLGEPVNSSVTATVVLKDNTAITCQILQSALTFHTKEGRLEIKLEGIKSFGDGRLLLRDGTILSGKLKEDLSIVKEDGTISVLKGRKIVSIVIKDIPTEAVTKELVETPKSGKREDKEQKSLTGEGGYVETGKVPPPPPPPNYTRIFKDTSRDTTSYWDSPYYPVPPYIPGPYGGYGTFSGGSPSSDTYGIPSRLTPPQGWTGSAVLTEIFKDASKDTTGYGDSPYGGYGTFPGGSPPSDTYGIPSRLTPPQGQAGSAVLEEEIKNESVGEARLPEEIENKSAGKARLPTEEDVLHGKVRLRISEAVDGDSLKVEYEWGGRWYKFDTEIRLIGIDAPEILVPGEEAKNEEKIKKDTALIAYFEGRAPSLNEIQARALMAKGFLKQQIGAEIRWEYIATDGHGRPLVYAYIGDRTSLNADLVAQCYAWPYLRPYSDKEHWGEELHYSEGTTVGLWLDLNPKLSREILEAGRIKYRKLAEVVQKRLLERWKKLINETNFKNERAAPGPIITPWRRLTDKVTGQRLDDKYNELCISADEDLRKAKMSITQAEGYLKQGNLDESQNHLNNAKKSFKSANETNQIAIQVFDGLNAAGEDLARGLQKVADTTLIGLASLVPGAPELVNKFLLARDFIADSVMHGIGQASKEAIVRIGVSKVFSEFVPEGKPVKGLGEIDLSTLVRRLRQDSGFRMRVETEMLKALSQSIAEDKATQITKQFIDEFAKFLEPMAIAQRQELEANKERQRQETERQLAKERKRQEQLLEAQKREQERLEAERRRQKEEEEARLLADGSLLRQQGRPEVYVIQNNRKYHIPNPETFSILGYDWSRVKDVGSDVLGRILPGDTSLPFLREGVLIRGSRPEVYVIQGGRRSWIPDPPTFKAKGYDWGKIVNIPDWASERIPKGPDVRR